MKIQNLKSKIRNAAHAWWDRYVAQFADDGNFRPLSVHRSPLMRSLVFYVWDYPFTRAGKLLIVAFFFSALPGAITEDVPMYCVPVALLALVLVLSGVGSIFRLAKCDVRANWPARVTAGQTVSVPVTITNTGWLPVYDLAVGCFAPPESWEPLRDEVTVRSLARGESAVLTARLIPWQRGVYRLPPIRVFSTFPFHLFRNEVTFTPGATLLVLPRFKELHDVRLETADRHQPGGIAYSSQVGESPEYIGNRDYTAGDALRRIDFRSWARLARPIVREYQDEFYSRIALVMDTYISSRRRPGRRGYPDLEAAVSLTAAVSEAVSRSEALIDIFAAGPELHVFRAGRSTAHFENILEILAGVGPCRTNPFETLGPALADQLQNISTVVLILLDWDEPRRRLVQAALEANCRVKLILIRDRDPQPPIDPALECVRLTPRQVLEGIDRL